MLVSVFVWRKCHPAVYSAMFMALSSTLMKSSDSFTVHVPLWCKQAGGEKTHADSKCSV